MAQSGYFVRLDDKLMKTKLLLLSALVLGAALVGAQAQSTNAVYSVNAVGYVNLTIDPGFLLIANPLNTATNTVSQILPNVPSGTRVFQFDGVNFVQNIKLPAGWQNPNMSFAPGEGLFIQNVTASPFTITCVGEVLQ